MPNFMDDYETVDTRIHRFWDKYPDGRIITHLEECRIDDNGRTTTVIIRAEVYKTVEASRPDSTGYAEESVATSTAPKGSIVETGETSAIGRALANLGFSAKGARPSREEMDKAQRSSGDTRPAAPRPSGGGTGKATAAQAALVAKMLEERGMLHESIDVAALSFAEASEMITHLKTIPKGSRPAAAQVEEEEPF